MSAENTMNPEHPTSLIAKKGNVTFEMWVEIDGKPLEVYAQGELMEGGSEAWIASENGKRYVTCIRLTWDPVSHHAFKNHVRAPRESQDFRAELVCDGRKIANRIVGKPWHEHRIEFQGTSVTADTYQPTIFTKPTLIEHGSGALPKQDLEKLGTIEVKFTRGTEGNALGQWEGSGRRQNQLVEPISEKAKKGAALLGSVTRLGDVLPAERHMSSVVFTPHPEDVHQEFFRLRIRHGPKDLLQAQGHIPLRVIGPPDGPGTSKRKAIDIDNVEEQEIGARKAVQAKKRVNAGKIPKETAQELEELREKLKALEEIAQLKAKIKALEEKMGNKEQR